jgi:Flp pilus assembly pilin Flp
MERVQRLGSVPGCELNWEVGMFERISLKLSQLSPITREDLTREEGQGATEYAMVLGFLVVGIALTLGVLGAGINNFLGDVAKQLTDLIP